MTEPATDDEFDSITSSTQLGALLRRLRGSSTQQNIADHAKRYNFYVHRPDLSAIERGHRLPTSNELRGILLGCRRVDLFDGLDFIRQRLMAEPADPATSNGRPQPVSHLREAPPSTDHEAVPGLRPREPDHAGRRRQLVITVFIAAVVEITTIVVLTNRADGTPPSGLDIPTAIEAAREAPLCAEELVPDPGVAPTVLAQDTGPADAVVPNRLVELHAYHDPQYGWIAWAHLAKSTSSRDRLWMDWSYLPEPTERESVETMRTTPHQLRA